MSMDKPTKRQLEVMQALPLIVDIRNVLPGTLRLIQHLIYDGHIKEMPADGAFMRRYVLTDWGKQFI